MPHARTLLYSVYYYATDGLCRTLLFIGDGKCRSAFCRDGLCRSGLWANWLLTAIHHGILGSEFESLFDCDSLRVFVAGFYVFILISKL